MFKKNRSYLKIKKEEKARKIRKIKRLRRFQKAREHDTSRVAYKLGVGGLVISLIGIVTCLMDDLQSDIATPEIFASGGPTFWFSFMHFFTNQVNILAIIYFFLFLVAFKTRLFNGHIFTMLTGSYIWIVFFVFWTMLAPAAFFTNQLNYNPMFIISTGWLHLITPLYYIVFSLSVVRYPGRTKFNVVDLRKYIPIGLIYPLLYSVYVVIINFIPLSDSVFSESFRNDNASFFGAGHKLYISVYGTVTNFNGDCLNIVRKNIEGIPPNTPLFDKDSVGSLWFLFMLPLVWAAFATTLLSFGYINNKFSGMAVKKNRR